jgi:SulP family sulfate permease
MIGAAVIPIIASLFGGTRIQASGPTAPMTAVSSVLIAYAFDHFPNQDLAEQFITLVFLLNGALLVIAGLVRLGKLIQLRPNVVVLGFMNGITLLIWFDQGAKLLALNGNPVLLGGVPLNGLVAFLTLAVILAIMWINSRYKFSPFIKILMSGVLLSILVVTAISVVLNMEIARTHLETSIGSLGEFFDHIARYWPSAEIFTLDSLLHALPYAAELTLLAYLDSLLTALVVDRMTHETSKKRAAEVHGHLALMLRNKRDFPSGFGVV